MELKVFKFGGASIADHELIKNVSSIIKSFGDNRIVVIISAMGKVTNALEKICNQFIESKKQSPLRDLMQSIIEKHLIEANHLGLNREVLLSKYEEFINQSQKALDGIDLELEAAIYDQIVPLGELFSTTLVEAYLKEIGLNSHWLDVRKHLKTDDNYKDARVDYNQSVASMRDRTYEIFSTSDYIITQGFIASAPAGHTTTLGREGSDYTAALFAYALDASELTIWKDVLGILTADPRRFDNVELLPMLSYAEAIEMTYYGASVIHPKTIRPIQNKSIKLNVRSYINTDELGTRISDQGLPSYPPIVVVQDNRMLLQITTKDFTFIAENHLSLIFKTLDKYRIKMSVMRNTAISFTLVIAHPGKVKLQKFLDALGGNFSFNMYENLQLITIRYAQKPLIESLTRNKVILFEERMKSTIQLVVRPALELKEKKV